MIHSYPPLQVGDWTKTVRITHHIVQQFIDWLRRDGTAFLVAPFEADAQVVHLVLCGYCAAAISEDSDLLAYRCPAVLYKLSPEDGHGKLITWEGLRTAQDSKGVLLFDGKWDGEWEAWEDGLFASLCILAGCDYLPSFPGVGVATAHKMLRSSRSIDRAIERLQQKVKGVPPSSAQVAEYLSHLRRCQEVFDHARVWDFKAGALIHLRPLPARTASDGEEFDHLGPYMDAEIAREVCCDASRDPLTLQPIVRSQAAPPRSQAEPLCSQAETLRSQTEPPRSQTAPRHPNAASPRSQPTPLHLPQFDDEDARQAAILARSPVAEGKDDRYVGRHSPDARSGHHWAGATMPIAASEAPRTHPVTSRHFFSAPTEQKEPRPSIDTRAGPSPVKRGLAAEMPPRKAARCGSPDPATSEPASRRSASARHGAGLVLPISMPPRVDSTFLDAFRCRGRA